MPRKHEIFKTKKSDGSVCLATNSGLFDPCQTICGDVENGMTYEDTNEPLTCQWCRYQFELLRHGLKIGRVEDGKDSE